MRRLILISALALCACPPRTGPGPGDGQPRVEVKPDRQADEALDQARTVADSKNKKAAVEAYLAVRKSYPESTAGQEALYRAGVLAYDEGDFVTARKALNELLFENPLHPNANDAKLKSGLAALELKQYRDAYQMLSGVADKLEGADKQKALDGLQQAQAGTATGSDLLKAAVKAVDEASDDASRAAAMSALEVTVESRASFLSIAEVWHDLPNSHPAWPMVTFKLARIYYHLRDWTRLDETLRKLIAEAPESTYTADARALLERTAHRNEVKPRVIGAVLPMSGKYKALGEAVVRGAQLALRGTNLELVVKDSQGDVNLAGKLVEELAFDNGAIAIIGPLLSDDSRRAALVAEELQVPIITMTRNAGITEIGPHVFRNMVTNQQQAEALADYAMNTLGYKSFAVLYPNIPFGVELSNAFWDEVVRRGGTIRGAETYDHDQTTFTDDAQRLVGRDPSSLRDRSDYAEQVREIRGNDSLDAYHQRKAFEKLKSNIEPVVDFEALLIPDSWQRVGLVAPALAVEDIITNGCDKRDLEKIMKTTGKKTAKELKTVTLLGPSTWSSPKDRNGDYELVTRGGKFVQCSVYVDGFYDSSNRRATKDFVAAYHDAYKDQQPGLLDAIGYDSAGMLKQLLEKNGARSRDELTQRLQALKEFDGATGSTSFDNKREAKKQLFLMSIDTKGIKEISPRATPPAG